MAIAFCILRQYFLPLFLDTYNDKHMFAATWEGFSKTFSRKALDLHIYEVEYSCYTILGNRWQIFPMRSIANIKRKAA